MAARKDIKKNRVISIIAKNAKRFIGSTIGIVRDEEVAEGTLPIQLYPAHYSDNSMVNVDESIRDLTVSSPQGNLPMWMRSDHAPNVSKRKIKRLISKNIKYKNHLLKLIKKNEDKAQAYMLRIRRDVNTSDDIYNLRKKYLETVIENREVVDELNSKNNNYLKLKLLSRVMVETQDDTLELLPADFYALRNEVKRLKTELEQARTQNAIKQLVKEEEPKPIKKKPETNDIVKAKSKTKTEPKKETKTKSKNS